jgi:hypothetical protein
MLNESAPCPPPVGGLAYNQIDLSLWLIAGLGKPLRLCGLQRPAKMVVNDYSKSQSSETIAAEQ